MRKELIRDSSVGFVLFIATLIAMAGLFLVGDGQGILADHVNYRVSMENAAGLRNGSRVYLSGVPVGSVAQIDFAPDVKEDKVIVTIAVNKQYARRIGVSSVAWLKNEGLLGDSAMHLSLSGQSAELPPESEIPYRQRAMLDDLAGEGTTQTATDLLETVMDILKDFQRGEGSLGQLLKNPELYDNLNSFTAAMRSATEEVDRVSEEVRILLSAVRAQKGTLGKLIFSESYAQDFERSLRNTDALIIRLDKIAAKIESGSGSLGKLVVDSAFYDTITQTSDRLSRVAQTTGNLLAELEESESVVGKLLRDKRLGADFEALVARLTVSARSVERILDKIERGEGSLGMLVHDPSIAGSLRDVFLGVKELGYVQNLVRNAEKAGRDAYLQSARLTEAERRELIRASSLARLRGEQGSGEPLAPAGSEAADEPGPGVEPNAKLVPTSGPTDEGTKKESGRPDDS